MREADIRPADLLNEYLRLSAEDAAQWFSDTTKFEHRACPGCGGDKPNTAFEKSGFSFAHCQTCGTLYANPVPAAGPLSEFYRDSPSQRYWGEAFFPAVAEARREHIFRPRVARVRAMANEMMGAIERVVDVGAGAGVFLEEAAAAGLGTRQCAIEPNADLVATCRRKGFDVFEGFAAEAAADPAWGDTADLVTCFEVIEHVADCQAFVTEIASLARPGGTILLTGLCGTGFDIITLGRHSKAVSPPHHLNFLSRAGVERLLQRCGLESLQFLTPGELDVDIVANTDRELGAVIDDPFVRHLLDAASQETRDSFQRFLADNGLSSHMWVTARKAA